MRALLYICVFVLSLAPLRAIAQQADITGVITSQIEAFKQDDFDTAFTYAHPNIQQMFRTPQNFGRMVTQGYPMVWRPSSVEYLSLREEGGRVFQDVQVIGPQGRQHVLEYSMTQTPQGWKISGVRILESRELSV